MTAAADMAGDASVTSPAEGRVDASMEVQPNCSICLDATDQLQELPCGHGFCGSCLREHVRTFHEQQEQNAYTRDHAYDVDNPPPPELVCPSCRKPFTESDVASNDGPLAVAKHTENDPNSQVSAFERT